MPRVGLSSLPGQDRETAFPSAPGRGPRPVLQTEPVTVLGPVWDLHAHLPARGRARSMRRNSQMGGPACRPFWETLPSLLEPRKPISRTPKALVRPLPLVPTCQHQPHNPTKPITQLVQGEAKAQPENLCVSRNCFLNAVSRLRGRAASGLRAEGLAQASGDAQGLGA